VTKIKTISYIVLVGSFLTATLAASASQLTDAELQAKLEETLKKGKTPEGPRSRLSRGRCCNFEWTGDEHLVQEKSH